MKNYLCRFKMYQTLSRTVFKIQVCWRLLLYSCKRFNKVVCVKGVLHTTVDKFPSIKFDDRVTFSRHFLLIWSHRPLSSSSSGSRLLFFCNSRIWSFMIVCSKVTQKWNFAKKQFTFFFSLTNKSPECTCVCVCVFLNKEI